MLDIKTSLCVYDSICQLCQLKKIIADFLFKAKKKKKKIWDEKMTSSSILTKFKFSNWIDLIKSDLKEQPWPKFISHSSMLGVEDS